MPHDEIEPDLSESTSQEVSLDRLSEAFAAVLRAGSKKTAAEPAPPAEPPVEEPIPQQEAPVEEPADAAAGVSPLTILEAMLFVGGPDNAPIEAAQAAALMRGVEPHEIHELVDQLNERYRRLGCAFEIISDGAGYRMSLREEFHRVRERFYGKVRHARLSQAAIDVLSLVAYNQPITRDDVDKLRGRPSAAVLNQLVRRQLLRIERPPENPRQALYHTTTRFLRLLGLSSLQDLPRSQDIDRP